MGAHVVTIESARALPGGCYDWGRKLTLQLTPEEMPVAIGVLRNLTESARFGQHGAQRDKFIELRRQAGGLAELQVRAANLMQCRSKPQSCKKRLQTQVCGAHLLITDEFLAGAGQGDIARFQHIAPVGNDQRRKSVLFDQQNGHALGLEHL